jgi:hypothetical protein
MLGGGRKQAATAHRIDERGRELMAVVQLAPDGACVLHNQTSRVVVGAHRSTLAMYTRNDATHSSQPAPHRMTNRNFARAAGIEPS